jgi:hypothetical protein
MITVTFEARFDDQHFLSSTSILTAPALSSLESINTTHLEPVLEDEEVIVLVDEPGEFFGIEFVLQGFVLDAAVVALTGGCGGGWEVVRGGGGGGSTVASRRSSSKSSSNPRVKSGSSIFNFSLLARLGDKTGVKTGLVSFFLDVTCSASDALLELSKGCVAEAAACACVKKRSVSSSLELTVLTTRRLLGLPSFLLLPFCALRMIVSSVGMLSLTGPSSMNSANSESSAKSATMKEKIYTY